MVSFLTGSRSLIFSPVQAIGDDQFTDLKLTNYKYYITIFSH